MIIIVYTVTGMLWALQELMHQKQTKTDDRADKCIPEWIKGSFSELVVCAHCDKPPRHS